MKRLGLWWIPLLLMAAPLLSRVPLARDVENFFLPMRILTAQRLAFGQAPWLNLANGCGEAWLANPETGVLYPPHLAYLAMGPKWGVSFEVGFHLALLALGVGLLALRLGAGWRGRWVAEAAVWASGPVLATIGVVNNLDTLAWLPWVVLAVWRDDRWTVPATAGAVAMAWLAGEPQLWLIGVGLAVLVAANRRRAMAGVILGALVVAVQMVPFAFWVAGGDRGGGVASVYLSGAVSPAGWLRLLVPGVPPSSTGFPYVTSLFLGAPILLCIVLGLSKRRAALVPVLALAVLATLPEIGLGGAYLWLTRELVRFPSRFAILAVVWALPFVGAGAEVWLSGGGRVVALVLGVLTMPLLAWMDSPLQAGLTAAAAFILCTGALWPAQRWLRAAALVTGLAACVVAGWPLLGLKSLDRPPLPWPEAAGEQRLYIPSPQLTARVLASVAVRQRRLWPIGYFNLEENLTLARTYAPVSNAVLQRHLEHADAGPSGRWWLDTLAAPWVLLPAPAGLPHLEVVRRQSNLWLHHNDAAWPLVTVAIDAPMVGRPWQPAGGLVSVTQRENSLEVHVEAGRPGWLVLSLAPVRGWTWRLDGRSVKLQPGAGILQQIRCSAGRHRLDGVYRPPGLVPAVACSGLALLGLLALAVSAASDRRHQQRLLQGRED